MSVVRALWIVIRGPIVLNRRDAPLDWSTWEPVEAPNPRRRLPGALEISVFPGLQRRKDNMEPMDDKVNLAGALETFNEPFSPRIVGYLNDYKLQVAKTKGEFVWHAHPDTDDFFLVVTGHLTIQMRDRDVVLGPGDLYVVPRGVEHCPRSDEGAEILLIEPVGTVNTGDAAPGKLTAKERML